MYKIRYLERYSATPIMDYLLDTVDQWFPKCAQRIPRDPQPVPRGSMGPFL
jgi:hypothetical protein